MSTMAVTAPRKENGICRQHAPIRSLSYQGQYMEMPAALFSAMRFDVGCLQAREAIQYEDCYGVNPNLCQRKSYDTGVRC
jgi:hypothetical protein